MGGRRRGGGGEEEGRRRGGIFHDSWSLSMGRVSLCYNNIGKTNIALEGVNGFLVLEQ